MKSMGPVEAVREAFKAVTPGLSLSKILADVGAEVKQMRAHGAHEMAAALFGGSGFVMYPRGSHEDPQHGLPEKQQEIGGREL